MRHLAALCILLILAAAGAHASADDAWFDPAYLEASSLNAGSGFILTPSPEILGHGVLGASIHRYQFKGSYGLYDFLELGVVADFDGYLIGDFVRNQIFFARLRLLSAERFGLGLSVGADGVGLEDLGGANLGFIPKASLEKLENAYVVAGGVLPFSPSLMLTMGYASGAGRPHLFCALAKVVFPGLLAMLEYDGTGTNLGARLLLSPKVKLDVAMVHTQELDPNQPFANVLERNIRFGITYSEPWPSRQEQD